MIFYGLMLGFSFTMRQPCFVGCHDIVKKFLIFVLIMLLTNFNSWRFHLCRQHMGNPFCTNILIRKNTNNVTHTFLWNAQLDSNFLFSSLSIVLNQFIILFPIKSSVAGTSCPPHCLSNKSAFSQCAILTFFVPAIYTAHINSCHNKQSAFGSEFQVQRLLWLSNMQSQHVA
jgi:hypothetical protein